MAETDVSGRRRSSGMPVDMDLSRRRSSATHAENSGTKPKKTFEFRMCKKVAELTQVVHMLFVRNHEKEVELDALKEAYEEEIDAVINDAKSRIAKLEGKINELEQQSSLNDGRSKTLLESELAKKDADWLQKTQNLEKIVAEEKSENQNMRDLLITAQKDIEQLRSAIESENLSKCSEMESRDSEIDRLKRNAQNLKDRIKDSEIMTERKIRELELSNSRLQNDMTQLQDLYDETRRTRDQYSQKTKQLENELKTVRKNFGRRISEVVTNQNGVTSKRKQSEPSVLDYKQELERMRKELQRYRLELSNREGNFNRVFSEHKPVHVDSRAGRIGLQQQQFFHTQSAQNFSHYTKPQTLRPEKTFSYVTSEAYDDEPFLISRSASASSSGRFPNLSATSDSPRSQVHKLVKPRAPRRELTSSGKF